MIKVICAVLEQHDRVLVTQRSEHMREPLHWEFPGGKIEPGEGEEECLVREIQEELGLTIEPHLRLQPVVYTSPNNSLELVPYLCTLKKGVIQLTEHRAYQWAQLQDLPSYKWCPADVPIVEELLRRLLPKS